MGIFVVNYKFYKQQEDGQWLVYFSDCDNEYPYWRLVSQTYNSFNPETAITPLIVA